MYEPRHVLTLWHFCLILLEKLTTGQVGNKSWHT